ncbi:MAG: hypothetical protein BJ554DRAFT_7617, partial [Olpidium bornovanus]
MSRFAAVVAVSTATAALAWLGAVPGHMPLLTAVVAVAIATAAAASLAGLSAVPRHMAGHTAIVTAAPAAAAAATSAGLRAIAGHVACLAAVVTGAVTAETCRNHLTTSEHTTAASTVAATAAISPSTIIPFTAAAAIASTAVTAYVSLTAAVTAAVTAAASAAGPLGRDCDAHAPTLKLLAIKLGHSLLGVFLVGEPHETEAARAPCRPVRDDLCLFDLPVWFKLGAKLGAVHSPREASNQMGQAETSALPRGERARVRAVCL